MSDLGNKDIMSKNIKKYVQRSGKSRSEISRDLGVSYSTFSDWYNGNTYPRIDKIEKLANYFNINKSDLVEEHQNFSPKKKSIKVPVLGQIAAGIPIEAIEDIIDYEEIDEEMAKSGEFFGLQIKGESMEPKFSEGDVIIVRKQPDVENGDIAVVIINGYDATVKIVNKRKDGIQLVATNPLVYTPTFYSNQEILELPIKILGRVVELRAKF